MSLFRPASFLFITCATGIHVAAQSDVQQHVGGLIGEDPDASNWPHPASPIGNPYVREDTASAAELAQRREQEQLGKLLFWEEQVSSDNSMACGTCHFMSSGGTDGRDAGLSPLATAQQPARFGSFGMLAQTRATPGATGATPIDYGHGAATTGSAERLVTKRHTPTMIGAYLFNELFWKVEDSVGPNFEEEGGTANVPGFDDWAALEALAVVPPLSDVEMSHEGHLWSDGFIAEKLGESFPMALVDQATIPPSVQSLVNSGLNYDQLFDSVFATHSNVDLQGTDGVTRTRFAAAIAHYMRTLIPDRAPIDVPNRMDADMVAGFDIVNASGCFTCHSASKSVELNSDGTLVDPFDNLFSDGSRDDAFFSGSFTFLSAQDSKIPTLRNLGLRERFLTHGHTFQGNDPLGDLVDLYDRFGAGVEQNLKQTGFLTPNERRQVMKFLFVGLTDPRVAGELPPFDRPTLASEAPGYTPFGSNKYGTGSTGSAALVPEIIANAQPYVAPSGNVDWFKLGVANATANVPARLLVGMNQSTGSILVAAPVAAIVNTTTNAQGLATVHNPVVLDSAVVGTTFYSQWQILQGGSPALSNAAWFTPFQ